MNIRLSDTVTDFAYDDPPFNTEISAKRTFTRKINSNYLGIPFYFKLHYRKFGFKGGIQYLKIIHTSYSTIRTTFTQASSFNRTNFNYENLRRRNFDLGPTFGVHYTFSDYLILRADAYFGLKPLNIEFGSPYRKAKNRQYTIGFNLHF